MPNLAADSSTISLILTSAGSCGGGAAGEWIFAAGSGIQGMTLQNDKDSTANVTFKGNAAYIDSAGTTFPSQEIPLSKGLSMQESAPASSELVFTVKVAAGATAYLILVK